MSDKNRATSDGFGTIADGNQWPGVESRFQLVVLAALRSKQLLRGASPRIDADPRRRRNTSIALEEIKQGLVPFTTGKTEQKGDGDGMSATEAAPLAEGAAAPAQVRSRTGV